MTVLALLPLESKMHIGANCRICALFFGGGGGGGSRSSSRSSSVVVVAAAAAEVVLDVLWCRWFG